MWGWWPLETQRTEIWWGGGCTSGGRQKQERRYVTGLMPGPAGETRSSSGQAEAGLQLGNLIKTCRRSIILNSNSKIYEVVTLSVLPGLDVPLQNSLPMQSQIILRWM